MEDNNSLDPKKTKGIQILLAIIILVLAAVTGILIFKYSDLKQDSAEVQGILEQQKTELETDLTNLQDEFGSLQTNNDSLQNLASEQQEKIEKLLKVQADNVYKIKMYQKELKSLREVLKSYIVQVDSLNTRNRLLTEEKQALSKSLSHEREQKNRLSEDKEKLTSTVQQAQVLSISDINVLGLNSRSKETQRVKNIEKLKTCFTVRENKVASASERVFYVQIVKPDKKVMPNKSNDTFDTQDGATLVYTDKRTIEYENKDIEVCIYSDNNNLTAGTYEVKVFCDGYLLGTYKFELK
jgi:chromosome segregation ATPase